MSLSERIEAALIATGLCQYDLDAPALAAAVMAALAADDTLTEALGGEPYDIASAEALLVELRGAGQEQENPE